MTSWTNSARKPSGISRPNSGRVQAGCRDTANLRHLESLGMLWMWKKIKRKEIIIPIKSLHLISSDNYFLGLYLGIVFERCWVCWQLWFEDHVMTRNGLLELGVSSIVSLSSMRCWKGRRSCPSATSCHSPTVGCPPPKKFRNQPQITVVKNRMNTAKTWIL